MTLGASKHIQKLARKHPAVRKQFFDISRCNHKCDTSTCNDPLEEAKYEPVKNMLHKYNRRVLVLLTNNCAAYCQFCTRKRKTDIHLKHVVNQENVAAMIEYIKNKSEINEIIFSGGDPLTAPIQLLSAMKQFSRLPQIKLFRVSTRLPVSDPKKFPLDKFLAAVKKIKQPIYLLVHINHPAEISKQMEKVVNQLRRAGCHVGSQTVFLRGVNDNYETLYKLFNQLLEMGVIPYNINHCDPVLGAEDFICGLDKEIEIMTKLRKKLSGLAYPLHVIDAPHGVGKMPVPTDFWQFDKNKYKDFDGKEHLIT